MEFKEITVDLPPHDCDVLIKFPDGQVLTVQARPGNAAENYNGSLDIILPKQQLVATYAGDDLAKSAARDQARPHERFAKQIVTDLPCDYSAATAATGA